MEYILLLTACINPDGMPFTCLADVGVRKKQYIEALNFYLKTQREKLYLLKIQELISHLRLKISSIELNFCVLMAIYVLIREKGKGMERRLYWNMQWPNLNLLLMMC